MAEFLELDDELDSLLGDFHPLISEADFDALLTLDLGITGAIAEPEPDEPEPIVRHSLASQPTLILITDRFQSVRKLSGLVHETMSDSRSSEALFES